MSVRVFNPMVMADLGRISRRGPVTPDQAALARVRRNLFGPVDHVETRRFVEQELAAMQSKDSEYYEFDFANGVPLPGSRRFCWQKVESNEVPASYALRRLPYLREHAEPEAAAAPESAAESKPAGAVEANNNATKQTRIDEFMKTRKRRICNSKETKVTTKNDSGTPPVKQARTSQS